MKLPIQALALVVFAILCSGIPAGAFDKTAQGITVTIGQTHVELASARSGIFRLSISLDSNPKPAASLFLAAVPPQTVDHWDVVTVGDRVGIKTGSGSLLIDPKTGLWTLLDATGRALINEGTLGHLQEGRQPKDAQLTFDVTMPTAEPLRFYGSGNQTPSLIKTEANSHLSNGVAVIPYYWCTAGYSAFGVTSDDESPAKWVTNGKPGAVTWFFPGKTSDLYLIPASTLYQAAEGNADLTGHPKVSPEWTFGYLQSRWGWKDRAYIDDTLKKFQTDQLPVDAFIFDFECYTKTPDYQLKPEGEANFPDFTWNPALLPEPSQQIAGFAVQGIHIVPIRKPRIGDSATLKMMHDKGWLLVTGKNGEPVLKEDARNLDFTNPAVRSWYEGCLQKMIEDGVAGWWDDEGESAYTKYYYWNLAEYEALAKIKPTQRHWSLNRAWQPGMGRLGTAAWTGDIPSDWETLSKTPASILNWGLSGMPYGACDIGGFLGRPTPEMLTRWMQLGVFLPIMRAHSTIGVEPRFPWLSGKDAEDGIRKALNLRYRLVPFYYSLAHETYDTGAPFMRPLVMEFPNDPKVQDLTDQWLMGTGLMAAPILAEGGRRKVYFPEGTWYKFHSNEVQQGQSIDVVAPLDSIPAYVRAGTILTLGPVIQNTAQLPGGLLEVQVYPGKNADFTLVEDDGISYGYLTGNVRKTSFHWDDTARSLTWKREGTYAGSNVFTTAHVVVFDPHGRKELNADLGPTGSLTP